MSAGGVPAGVGAAAPGAGGSPAEKRGEWENRRTAAALREEEEEQEAAEHRGRGARAVRISHRNSIFVKLMFGGRCLSP